MNEHNQELARHFGGVAKKQYAENAGEVMTPILILHSGDHDELAIAARCDDIHPSDRLCELAAMFAPVMEANYLLSITEGWGRPFKEQEGRSLQRGDLAKMREAGDTEVHTHLMVSVMDVKMPIDTVTMTIDCDDDFDEHFMEGIDEQNMPRRILQSYEYGRSLHPPEGMTWEHVAAVAGSLEMVVSVMGSVD